MHVDPSSADIKVKVKLPKFVEGQDVEVFLTSFERLATVHNWPKINGLYISSHS